MPLIGPAFVLRQTVEGNFDPAQLVVALLSTGLLGWLILRSASTLMGNEHLVAGAWTMPAGFGAAAGQWPDPPRLVANLGTWRVPLAASFLFAFLFVNSAFIAARLVRATPRPCNSWWRSTATWPGRMFLDALEHQRFELEAKGVTAAQAVQDAEASVGLTLPAGLDDRLATGEDLTLQVHQRTHDNVSLEATGWLLSFLSDEYGVSGSAPGGLVLDEKEIADDPEANRDQFARLYAALAAFLALGTVTSVASILGGTRDRRGAEALLVLPVPRSAIAGGTAAGVAAQRHPGGRRAAGIAERRTAAGADARSAAGHAAARRAGDAARRRASRGVRRGAGCDRRCPRRRGSTP